MASSITNTTLDTSVKNTQSQTARLNTNFNDFLRILTTQLQNQDPLDPMDSTQFTNQLVMFSQVEQQLSTNSKLDNLLKLQNTNVVSNALGYVGKDVTFTGNEVYYEGSPLAVTYTMKGNAVKGDLRIVDETGNVIRTIGLGNLNGTQTATWNGKDDSNQAVPNGVYTVRLDALDEAGAKVDSTMSVPGTVDGIETVDGAVQLQLTGNRTIPLTDILSIKQPTPKTQA